MKEMDSAHSGTGVFYQAMPAVGADGKNIMKLIPVQMVNGQFVQSQISQPKMDPMPQKAVTTNIASAPVQMLKKSALNPSATQQIVRKQVALMNVLPNQVGTDLSNSLNKHPLQQQNVNLMATVPSMATSASNSGKSERHPSQLPVTVKSSAFPIGHHLQIPPNAQVRTVSASELPQGIKKQIFTSSTNSSPSSSLPSVAYVSPTTTGYLSTTPQSDSELKSLELLCDTSNKTLLKGSKPNLKLIPKASQRPNSPIKWVIEEEESAVAPTLDPVNSSVTSEIVRVVAERENAGKYCDDITKLVSRSSEGKSGKGQENTLVMSNGKVFFVAKNCSLPYKMGKSDSPYQPNKTTVSLSQPSLESVASDKKQGLRNIIPHESEEVIDLCDDDAHNDSSQQAAPVHMSAVTDLDEDNVIFVSYIPPKSESNSTQGLRPKTQTALNKPDQTGRRSLNSVTEQESLNGTADNDDRDEILHDNEGSNISSQQSTSTQQFESMEVTVETKSPAEARTSDSSSGICSRLEKDALEMKSSINPTSQTSLLAPETHQMADNLLRQIFGITANVKICLQRIDEASLWCLPAKPLQSESIKSLEDHQEPTSGLKRKDLYTPQDVKRVNVLTKQELSEESGPLKCSHFKLNTKPLSVFENKCHSDNTSLKRKSYDVETEPVIGYIEPIDEDFLSIDENDIPNSQDPASGPQTQTCVDPSMNTRRIGRTRKRTICLCCIPGTQGPAVKSSAKSEEPERWTWTTERTNKEGGGRKAVRKDVKTSERINCLTAKKKHDCKTYDEVPTSDSLPTTSMDSDKLQQHEQIKRLKELLKEKEAA